MSETAPKRGGMSTQRLIVALLLLVALAIGITLRFVTLSPKSDLTIVTQPAGATIFINGRLAGATPLVVRGIDPGTYSLRIEKENYAPVLRTLDLHNGGIPVNEILPRIATGIVRVDMKPDGAEVVLDGEIVGQTPLYLPDVQVGEHELLVRKTNCNPYSRRINVEQGKQLAFNDELEDRILTMLNGNIAKEKSRVAHYVDLGHYLFVNNRLNESAEAYAQALEVAGTPIEFEQNVTDDERRLEVRLRAEDQNRLNDELRKKEHWPGKDLTTFVRVVEHARETVTNAGNYRDWNWTQEQANNYVRDGKVEDAQKLLIKHIEAVKEGPLLAQAYINLMSVRLKMKKMDSVAETYNAFMKNYGTRPELLRQAGNAMYSTHSTFEGKDRDAVLNMAETMFRNGVKLTKHGEPELKALCNFELGNVFVLQNRAEQAIQPYRDSIDGTNDKGTKELRSQRLVECFKGLRKFADARKVLVDLEKSKSQDISDRAKQLLKEIDLIEPSPDNK
jgi:tetratricopeptide (TPR) repeat protein